MPPSQLFSSPGGWVIVRAKLENRNLWIYTVMLTRFPNALCKSTVNHPETYMLMCFFHIRMAIFATTSWLENHWVPKPKPETGCAKNLALQNGQPFNGGPFTWKSCPQSLEMNRWSFYHFGVKQKSHTIHGTNGAFIYLQICWWIFYGRSRKTGRYETRKPLTFQDNWHIPLVARGEKLTLPTILGHVSSQKSVF